MPGFAARSATKEARLPRATRFPASHINHARAAPPPIAAAATDVTAFVGRARRGPFDRPRALASFAEFERVFGGLWSRSTLGYAVRDFFAQGGRSAWVVRVRSARRGTGSDAATRLRAFGLDDPARQAGLYALDKIAAFNLLCIPPHTPADGADGGDLEPELVAAAVAYCARRRAFMILDPPQSWKSVNDVRAALAQRGDPRWFGSDHQNAALFFPRLLAPDPLAGGGVAAFAPCGGVAGVIARTDAARGVWKAAAGTGATLTGATGTSLTLNDAEAGDLNRLAVNAIRTVPANGTVVWGARTRHGADDAASPWRYITVCRTALMIEESLSRGLNWAVFEANGEVLWARVRAVASAFMLDLFRQGAFPASRPEAAFFVRCGADTTTAADIAAGVMNVEVGFAPLQPAEFVILRFAVRTGDGDE